MTPVEHDRILRALLRVDRIESECQSIRESLEAILEEDARLLAARRTRERASASQKLPAPQSVSEEHQVVAAIRDILPRWEGARVGTKSRH